MTKQLCKNCKHLETDGMFGIFCGVGGNNRNHDCSKYEEKSEKRFTKYVPDSYGYTYITTIIDNEKNKQTGNTDEIVDMLNELNDENKQLHRVIEENEKLIQSTYDELTKLRCIKKNLRRIKAQYDWIMEAIQYD